jgi:hypothetical protein
LLQQPEQPRRLGGGRGVGIALAYQLEQRARELRTAFRLQLGGDTDKNARTVGGRYLRMRGRGSSANS